jgi:hypothetical protein
VGSNAVVTDISGIDNTHLILSSDTKTLNEERRLAELRRAAGPLCVSLLVDKLLDGNGFGLDALALRSCAEPKGFVCESVRTAYAATM